MGQGRPGSERVVRRARARVCLVKSIALPPLSRPTLVRAGAAVARSVTTAFQEGVPGTAEALGRSDRVVTAVTRRAAPAKRIAARVATVDKEGPPVRAPFPDAVRSLGSGFSADRPDLVGSGALAVFKGRTSARAEVSCTSGPCSSVQVTLAKAEWVRRHIEVVRTARRPSIPPVMRASTVDPQETRTSRLVKAAASAMAAVSPICKNELLQLQATATVSRAIASGAASWKR